MKIVKEYVMHSEGIKSLKKAMFKVLSFEAFETMNLDYYVREAEEHMSGEDWPYVEILAHDTNSRHVELIKCEPSWFDVEEIDLDEDF